MRMTAFGSRFVHSSDQAPQRPLMACEEDPCGCACLTELEWLCDRLSETDTRATMSRPHAETEADMPVSALKSIMTPIEETLPVYDAVDLTQGGGLARIKLADQLYTLRITRAGKLILTK